MRRRDHGRPGMRYLLTTKRYMRARVAEIIVETLESIGLEYPAPGPEELAEFGAARAELVGNSGQ